MTTVSRISEGLLVKIWVMIEKHRFTFFSLYSCTPRSLFSRLIYSDNSALYTINFKSSAVPQFTFNVLYCDSKKKQQTILAAE